MILAVSLSPLISSSVSSTILYTYGGFDGSRSSISKKGEKKNEVKEKNYVPKHRSAQAFTEALRLYVHIDWLLIASLTEEY